MLVIRSRIFLPTLFVLLAFVFVGCLEKKEAAQSSGSGDSVSSSVKVEMTVEQKQERGKLIYQTNCIACHNPDPKQVGTVGPAIWGASRELLAAKVLKGDYPDGYKKQRETRIMPQLPHLEKELEAVSIYLNK